MELCGRHDLHNDKPPSLNPTPYSLEKYAMMYCGFLLDDADLGVQGVSGQNGRDKCIVFR